MQRPPTEGSQAPRQYAESLSTPFATRGWDPPVDEDDVRGNALRLKLFCCLDSLPSGRYPEDYTSCVRSHFLVLLHQVHDAGRDLTCTTASKLANRPYHLKAHNNSCFHASSHGRRGSSHMLNTVFLVAIAGNLHLMPAAESTT